MERVAQFLKEAETYYLATVEGDQPRVRPFGTAHIFEGKLYIQTGKVKDVSKQIHTNPKVEICAFKNGEWLRVAGELVEDDRREARQSMALGKGAYAIHQSGKWYTNENIDQMLMERHLNKKVRRSSHKNHMKGPRKRTEEDDVRFAQSFEKLILMAKSKEGAQSGTI